MIGATELVDEEIRCEGTWRYRGVGRRSGDRTLRCFGHRESEASALECQRFAIAVVEFQHFPDEDDVVSALVLEGGAALEPRNAALK